MPKVSVSLTLLSLFTSRDQASEIEGDLLEQKASNGGVWYAFQVLFTCIALLFNYIQKETGLLILLSYGTYELFLKINWFLIRKIRFKIDFILMTGSVGETLINWVCYTIAGSVGGLIIVKASPRLGPTIIVLAICMMMGRLMITSGLAHMLQIFCFAGIPLLIGMYSMRWLQLVRDGKQLPAPISQ